MCVWSSVYLSNYLYLSVCLSGYLSICKFENEALLRDFLNSWTWRRKKKRNNSARFPHFLNLTTSKTKQVCETSSILEVDNIKNEAILRHFLQKWKVECKAGGRVPMRFAIFPLHLSKVLRLPRKSAARSYEVLHHAESSQETWRSDVPKCNLSQEISALTSEQLWWTCLLYCACPAKCIFADPLQMSHACHRFWSCHKTLAFYSLLKTCIILCACHSKQYLNV